MQAVSQAGLGGRGTAGPKTSTSWDREKDGQKAFGAALLPTTLSVRNNQYAKKDAAHCSLLQ